LLGQILHKLLERIDTIALGGAINSTALAHHLETICAGLGVFDLEEIQAFQKRATSDLQNFVNSDYAKLAMHAAYTKTEFPVHAALSQNDHLRGIIDRFFITADGDAHILDYKTDQTTGKENPQKRERYHFQVKFYAYLVSLLYPEKDHITATLFYTRNGEFEQYKFDRESFRGIEQTLAKEISNVRALEEIKSLDEIYRNLQHCRECQYFDETAKVCVATLAG
jgi:ATP-dependent exoDNAse (exonuclease V) beta subunit